MKKCSGCEEFKDYSCFHKNKNKNDGLNNICKICKSLYHNGFKKPSKSKILSLNDIKKCPKCNLVMKIDNFFNNKNTSDNLNIKDGNRRL